MTFPTHCGFEVGFCYSLAHFCGYLMIQQIAFPACDFCSFTGAGKHELNQSSEIEVENYHHQSCQFHLSYRTNLASSNLNLFSLNDRT